MNEDVIYKAWNLAILAHKLQLRSYTYEPYINHCVRVAHSVVSINGTQDMVAAALLHDPAGHGHYHVTVDSNESQSP